MELKPGYKQTEAGVIPEDWDAEKLGNFVSLQRGHDLTWRDRRPGGVPVMGSAGQNGFHDTALAKGPGVVLGRSGASFGQAHYCEKDFWPHNTALYVTDFRGNDPLFVFYFLKSIDFTRHNSGGAQQSLNRNFIYPIPVGVPRLPEQRLIAEALSDMDALIGVLDQLIAKKRDLKQAAMQQLLTGKTRLPGFHGEWELTSLGQIISRFSTGLNPRQNFQLNAGGSFFYVTIKNFARGQLFLDEQCDLIDEAAFLRINERSDLRRDDILFSSIGRVGDAYLIRETPRNWNINESVFALRPDKTQVVPLMLFYLLTNKAIRDALDQGVTGSTFKSIKQAALKAIRCRIPISHDEQTAIAAVLSDMDAELATLEQRRDKTRDLKQGMMQELLTGRTRLV